MRSTSSPDFLKMPVALPTSTTEKEKAVVSGVPTRTFSSACASPAEQAKAIAPIPTIRASMFPPETCREHSARMLARQRAPAQQALLRPDQRVIGEKAQDSEHDRAGIKLGAAETALRHQDVEAEPRLRRLHLGDDGEDEGDG